jgi:Ala-tRNA(Pro) deacylase
MERLLDITPGAVSVLGLMNDTENQVRLLVDGDILKSRYVGCHPCVNTASLRLRVEDVFGKFLRAVHHDYTVVQLGDESME